MKPSRRSTSTGCVTTRCSFSAGSRSPRRGRTGRAIIGPGNGEMPGVDRRELAESALRKLRDGERPDPAERIALNLAIRLARPSLLSQGGVVEALPAGFHPAFVGWAAFRTLTRPFLHSVGRLDLAEGARGGVGTGFLVSDTLLVTNTHVLDALTGKTRTLDTGQAVVRFKREFEAPDEDPVKVQKIVAVHEDLDLTLLEIEPGVTRDGRRPLVLEPTAKAAPADPVVTVGYPLEDRARNPEFVDVIFGDRFGVKRTAPGQIVKVGPRSISHDCSTLGGNSGSPVLSMKTAHVVGVHNEGYFLGRNEAVPAAFLDELIRSRTASRPP